MSDLNHFPSDLIEAVLPFLPPKSLGRFKSVSKRWYSLISSPNFIKTHVRNYTKSDSTHLILVPEDAGCSLYSLDIKQLYTLTTPETLTAKRINFQEQLSEIMGSCNGLVLAIDRHDDLYLVNPTTRKTLKIPAGKSIDETYGFGYDSSNDDYKVIFISDEGVYVYSLRNNSWNTLPNFPFLLPDYRSVCEGVFINNNLHWVVRRSRHTLTIAAFCLADEVFHEIELPDSVNFDKAYFSQLYAFGGKLVVVYWLPDPEFPCELWVMEEYGVPKSWKKLCIFQIEDAIRQRLDYFEFYAQISNQAILLGERGCNNKAGEIFIYNMDERRCTSVTVEGRPEGLMVSGTYVESLESLERFV